MTKATRVVIDSCTLTTRLEGAPAQYVQGIQNLFSDVDSERVQLLGSTLLLVEVLGGGFGELPDPAKDAVVLAVLNNPKVITLIQVARQVALIARELRPQYRLKVADSVHLATAVFGNAEYFMTTDKDDFPIGATVRGVKVQLPDSPHGNAVLS